MIFTPNDNVHVVYSADDNHNFTFAESKEYQAAIDAYAESREYRELNSLMRERSAVKL